MKDQNAAPDASEFGLLRAYLAQQGVSQATITEAVGTDPNGRTRAQIASELRDWLKVRPKAT